MSSCFVEERVSIPGKAAAILRNKGCNLDWQKALSTQEPTCEGRWSWETTIADHQFENLIYHGHGHHIGDCSNK